MSWLSDFMKGGKNPADAAMPYLNQIPGVGHNAYDTYIQQGQQAGNTLSGEYGKMLDPTAFIKALMKDYQPSEGYQYQLAELGKGIGNTAAAGGIAGTPEHQKAYGQMAQGLMSEDMQQFLENALGIYDKGISGEKDIYDKGFGASGSLADILGGILNSQAGLAFQGQAQKNQNKNDLLKMFMQALGGAGGFMTGGGTKAGPMSGSSFAPWNNPG